MPEPSGLQEFISKTFGNSVGVKVGPGVLPIIGAIWGGGLIALAVSVWALQSNPWLAGGIALLIVASLAYVTERLVRYAEKDPVSALLGGAHLLKVIERQMGAKDPKIISGDDRTAGVIEAAGDSDE